MKYKLIGNNNYKGNIQHEILLNRGIENIKDFLNPTRQVENDYSLFENIDKAVECLDMHIQKQSKILLVVDSDVDGYTSSAIIYQYLCQIEPNINIEWTIHKHKGHNLDDIKIGDDINLIIVPDAGSNDIDVHKTLHDRGIDCIILDHHDVDINKFYDNIYLINNQCLNYTNKNLSGAGVTYKFCQALDNYYWVDYADNYLDLVALGNIGDMMDIRELETKYYIEKGLQQIKNPFFQALIDKQSFSIKGELNPLKVAFYIVPLINAMIRLGDFESKKDMFRAFIGENRECLYKPRGKKEEIKESLYEHMARKCYNIKNKQNRVRDKILDSVINNIKEDDLKHSILIVDISNIEDAEGMTGLIGNQLLAKYKKPVFIIHKIKNNPLFYRGSMRSPTLDGKQKFKDIMEQTNLFYTMGGHKEAAGFTIETKNICRLYDVFDELLKDYVFDDCTLVDFIIPYEEFNIDIICDIYELRHLWGQEFPEPFIVIKNIEINTDNITIEGSKQNILKFYDAQNDIAFTKYQSSIKEYDEIMKKVFWGGITLNILGTANINEYDGQLYMQIIIDQYEILNE